MRYKIEFDLPDSKTLLENIDSTYASWEVLSCSGYAKLTPVDAERKTGKWIEITPEEGHDIYTVKCDQCGVYEFFETNYCHNCGTKMEGKA